MRIRDTFHYFCPFCWSAVILMGLPLVPISAFTIYGLIATSANVAFLWLGAICLAWLSVLALCSYFEARSHWKQGE